MVSLIIQFRSITEGEASWRNKLAKFLAIKMEGRSAFLHRDGIAFDDESKLADYIRSLDTDGFEGLSDEFLLDEAFGLNEWIHVN